MAVRAKEDTIVESQCLYAAQHAIGNRITPIFGFPYKFAVNAARLAKELFSSRSDIEYILKYPIDERQHTADTVWAATLLSQAGYFGDLSYDSVAELTNSEVASYMQYVHPTKTMQLFAGIFRMMIGLGQCNGEHNFGPIFSVLGSMAHAASIIGTDPNVIQSKLNTATDKAYLWSIQYAIKQLDRACVSRWSPYVADALAEASAIAATWTNVPGFPTNTASYNVEWKLDMTIPQNIFRKEYEEVY